MIAIKKYSNENEIKKLYKKHFGKNLTIDNNIIYCLYDDNNIVGYVIYKIENNNVIIDWIYSPNYGKIFMKKLENKFKKHKYDKILLKLSIDPTENVDKVMKRINFYISLQYKVYNINFRKKYGPLLFMKKTLQ